MIDRNQTVTLDQLLGMAVPFIVLLLVLLLATFVYFSVRMKLLRSRVANLEFEMKIVAEKVGLIPKSEPK